MDDLLSLRQSPAEDAGEAIAYAVGSVDNALSLLLILAERPSIRVCEAADLLGVARSTAHRLLSTLRGRGFVKKDPVRREYIAGPALATLARASMRAPKVLDIVKPFVHAIQAETGETVHFLILQGSSARFVYGFKGSQRLSVDDRTGIVLPAHCTAGGKATLAQLSASYLKTLYPRGMGWVRPNAATSLAALEGELREVRVLGYATNFGESAQGIAAVAVPVNVGPGFVAALAVATPSSRLPHGRVRGVAATLRRAATEVEAKVTSLRTPPVLREITALGAMTKTVPLRP